MKIAVCLYGYPRHSQIGYKSLSSFLEGMDYDFFIHSWCDKEVGQEEFDTLNEEIKQTFKPKDFLLERQIDFKNSFDFDCDLSYLKREFVSSGKAIPISISPLYSILQVSHMLKKSEENYDLVILTRTDIFCTGKLKNHNFTNLDEIYSSYCTGSIWDLNNGGDHIDVKMILSSRSNMLHLMDIYNSFEKYLKDENIKLCHHRLFAHHLKKLDKKFNMIFTNSSDWYIIRDGGFLENEMSHSNMKNFPQLQ